jgi:conjugative transfer region protein (TIGR03750 family)
LGGLGFLLGFIASVTVMPKPMAQFKEGTPYGYWMKKAIIALSLCKIIPSPYIRHRGLWKKSKLIRSNRV